MKKTLKIKKESVVEFFRDKLVADFRHEIENPYTFLKNTLFIKKNVWSNDFIEVQMSDRSNAEGTKLINIYTYAVFKHDDICDRLELKDFKVEIEELGRIIK